MSNSKDEATKLPVNPGPAQPTPVTDTKGSERVEVPPVITPGVTIEAPAFDEEFYGSATGKYEPSMISSVACEFWKTKGTGAPVGGYVTYPGRLAWKAEFEEGKLEQTEEGYLKATCTLGLETATAGVVSLNVSPPMVPVVTVRAGPPRVRIREPENATDVRQFFRVQGTYTPGKNHSVEVELISPTAPRPLALVLPTVELPSGEWVTAIFSFESGEGYKIRAVLKDDKGHELSKHSVANIKIG